MNAPAPALSPPLARQRNVILAVLLVLAAAGWAVVVAQSGDDGGMSTMGGMGDMGGEMASSAPDLTMGSASLFFVMWVAMMVAMMFPAAAPMIVLYARTQRGWRHVTTALFTGSYIALWFAFGLVAFALGVAVEELADDSRWVSDHWGRVGGALLVAAGLYQLSPLKDYCLSKCRSPLAFIMTSWREGPGGAVRMGLHHGLYCVGCCWLLFLVVVPLGVMNVAAMLLVGAVVFAEKALPWGRGAARVAAVALVVYGALAVVEPSVLPTVA